MGPSVMSVGDVCVCRRCVSDGQGGWNIEVQRVTRTNMSLCYHQMSTARCNLCVRATSVLPALPSTRTCNNATGPGTGLTGSVTGPHTLRHSPLSLQHNPPRSRRTVRRSSATTAPGRSIDTDTASLTLTTLILMSARTSTTGETFLS